MQLHKKNKFLLLSFCLALYLSYHFAIAKTWFYYQKSKQNQAIANTTTNSPVLLAKLKLKEKQLDKLLATNNGNEALFQKELLKNIALHCESLQLKITDFKEPHYFVSQNTLVNSYRFSVSGSYVGVLKLLNKLENTAGMGVVRHVETIKKMDYKTNTEYLISTVLIEKNFEKNSNS
jgi:hypothetical protein